MVGLARSRQVPLKLVGGLGVRALSPSSRVAPLARAYKDLDLALPFRARPAVIALLTEAGYEENKRFNAMNGHTRMIFLDPENGRQVDLFVDRMHLCHQIDLRSRLDHDGLALTPADMLLSKLQIVQMTQKDQLDLVALLADLPLADDDSGIDQAYLARLTGEDWGLWRTVTYSLEKVEPFVREHLAGWEPAGRALERAQALARLLHEAPKSLKWRMRAAVGEKLRWYELPDEGSPG